MITVRPTPPMAYSATISRSDGIVTKVFIEPGRQRHDSYRAGLLERISMFFDDRREAHSYELGSRECTITRLPSTAEMRVRDPYENATFVPEAEETLRGMGCTRFRVERGAGAFELQWYDEVSGLCVQVQTFNVIGEPVLRIEWSEIRLGPLADELFEPIPDFREFRIP